MRRGRGFTLIELLAVNVMIGGLVALLLPVVQSARSLRNRVVPVTYVARHLEYGTSTRFDKDHVYT
jgi:prepilin-type N-terminal cleavage/methylation domain-containing protein